MVRRIRRGGAGNDGHGHRERRAGHGQVPAGLRFHHRGQAPPRGVPMIGGGAQGGFGAHPPASQQSPVMTKEQAAAAAQAALSERDAIQVNLLELDGSFGKRLLEGATLSGGTKRRWDVTAASLANLWEIYSAYSAVIDRAADMVNGHLGPRELAAITNLLTGPSIQLTAGPGPLAGRDLADSGRENLTVVAAGRRM